jgi:hypothetical protein
MLPYTGMQHVRDIKVVVINNDIIAHHIIIRAILTNLRLSEKNMYSAIQIRYTQKMYLLLYRCLHAS